MSLPHRQRASLAALLIANAIPIVGVALFGWDLSRLLMLYWLENIVVGAYTVLRISTAKKGTATERAALIPFFIMHFGVFTFVHGIFVLLISSGVIAGTSDAGIVGAPAALLGAVGGLLPAAVALAFSHGVSYVTNFLDGGERDRLTPREIMMRPYGRIVVLHLTILIGAFLALAAQSAAPDGRVANLVFPLLLIALKTAFDAKKHLESHAVRPSSPVDGEEMV